MTEDERTREHAAHELEDISTSWGGYIQCHTCRVVIAADSSEGPLPWIPHNVRYRPKEGR